jgi:hypothetical protein
MAPNRLCAVAVIAVAMIQGLGEVGLAQGEPQSLRDSARRNGGRANLRIHANMPFGSLPRVVEVADLIVRGRVLKAEPRLSKDEDYVLTYFTLAPTEFLKGSRSAKALSRPGFVPPIVFVEPGGTVREDGLEMSTRHNMTSDPPLQVGEEVLAFLTEREERGTFRLQYAAFSLFRVDGDRVGYANKEIARHHQLVWSNLVDVLRTVRGLVTAPR